jgi:hypothetical protein
LVPVQSFTDFSGTDRSVGQELEIYSYAYSTGTNVTPAVTGSVVGAGAVQIILPNVTATFAPADDIYVGAPPGVPAPSSISVAASHASMATNGAGLHLQGGSSLLFSGNTFGDLLAPNQYAVQVDVPSVSYSSVLLQDNNFAAFSNAAVHFSSGTGSGLGPAIEFIGNIGYRSHFR